MIYCGKWRTFPVVGQPPSHEGRFNFEVHPLAPHALCRTTHEYEHKATVGLLKNH